jgi:hypothetical protein
LTRGRAALFIFRDISHLPQGHAGDSYRNDHDEQARHVLEAIATLDINIVVVSQSH